MCVNEPKPFDLYTSYDVSTLQVARMRPGLFTISTSSPLSSHELVRPSFVMAKIEQHPIAPLFSPTSLQLDYRQNSSIIDLDSASGLYLEPTTIKTVSMNDFSSDFSSSFISILSSSINLTKNQNNTLTIYSKIDLSYLFKNISFTLYNVYRLRGSFSFNYFINFLKFY